MADLTITVAVTTGTQYITGSTSNIFTFDGSQPASFTFPWVEDGTVRLEQSGSSNDGHPLIFSTSNSTVLATMRTGIISSGVTYYLDGSSTESDYTNTTTFNAATTRYIEITPAAATDFYFACWVHGIGMGGIVDITQITWGALGYGDNSWGGVTASLTGLSMTATLGDLAYAASTEGWGRDQWGQNDWGSDTFTVSLTGLEMTASLGLEGWGRSTWGNDAWGEESVVNIEIVEPLTGFSITGSLGTPQINYDFKVTLTDSLLGTLSLGSLTTIPDMVIGVSGYAITASLGTVTEEVITFPTGYSATMSLGTVSITSNPLVVVSGYSITGSLGSLGTIDDMQIGVSGYSITGSLGTTTVTDMQIGVTGFEVTGNLGSGGVSPLHYKDVDITGNTSYTNKSVTGYTAYTDIEHSG
jgi:hypothetical protein